MERYLEGLITPDIKLAKQYKNSRQVVKQNGTFPLVVL